MARIAKGRMPDIQARGFSRFSLKSAENGINNFPRRRKVTAHVVISIPSGQTDRCFLRIESVPRRLSYIWGNIVPGQQDSEKQAKTSKKIHFSKVFLVQYLHFSKVKMHHFLHFSKASITKSLIICKKVFFVCIVCAKKKEKRETKAPPHPLKERAEKKRKRKEKEVHS